MKTLVLSVALLLATEALAQDRVALPLWEDDNPPYYKPHEVEEIRDDNCWGGVPCLLQISNALLTVFLPEGESNGAAVVILPGGGYEAEAVYHEGYDIAEALAATGTVAAVLKYRLPSPETSTKPWLVPEADVRRALQRLRTEQSAIGFTADRYGVMGFSAGGHLAASVSVHRTDDPTENPDFSMLIYGVTLMNDENRQWLEDTLYHRPMTGEEVAYQALVDHVDESTPPAFLVHARDDNVVPVEESTRYDEALKNNGVNSEIHVYEEGGHGFGPGREEDGTSEWLGLAADWLYRFGSTL